MNCMCRCTATLKEHLENILLAAAMTTPSSDDEFVNPESISMLPVMIAAYVPMFLISELGNGFVIYSLVYLKRSHLTVTDCYALSLSIADFLLTTLTLFNGLEYLHNEWILGKLFCKIQGTSLELSNIVSTLTVAAISYSRREAINDPFKMLQGRKKIKRIIIFIWLGAMTLSSPLIYAYTVVERNGRLHCSNRNFGARARQIYYLLHACVFFFVPVAIMIVSQRKITDDLRTRTFSAVVGSQADNSSNARNFSRMISQERHIRKFLTFLWVIFVCCFTPHIVMRTINHFTLMREKSKLANQIWHISQLLIVLNSSINPYLYYKITNRKGTFTQHILKFCCCLELCNRRVNI